MFYLVIKTITTPSKKAVVNLNSKIIDSIQIEYPSRFNFRQGPYDCGPNSVAAVIRILKDENISSDELAKSMEWRLDNKYTLPWGLENKLKEYKIDYKILNLKNLTDQEKIKYLQNNLYQKKPIIILGEINKYQHYITLLGYNNNEEIFYVYDSMHTKSENGLTVDDNGELTGNRNMTNEELLNFWRDGGMFGIYKWYALVASVKE